MTRTRKVGRCKDLGTNLLECIRLFRENQNLMKLISDTSIDPTSKPDLSRDQITALTGRYLFPFLFNPEIETEKKTFLMINFARVTSGRINQEAKNYLLNVRFYCHKDIAMVVNNTRALAILHEIDDTLNDVQISSLGTVKFAEAREISTNRLYHGFDVYYHILDFN